MNTAYDNQNITVRGNPTSVRRKLIGESRFLTATSGYDMTGNVVSETDAKSNTTTRTFTSSTNYALPRYTTNALGQQSEQTWKQYSSGFNYYNGDLATAIDANGAAVYYWYDELGRTTQINTPIGLTNYSYDDYDFETTEMSSSGTQYTKVDSSSEVIETRQDDPEVEDDILTTMGYNNPWQQASSVSFPYRDGGTPTNATYTYDPLGRALTEAVPSVGTTSYLYVGNTVTVTNPENKKKKYTYDELGNISQVTGVLAAGLHTQIFLPKLAQAAAHSVILFRLRMIGWVCYCPSVTSPVSWKILLPGHVLSIRDNSKASMLPDFQPVQRHASAVRPDS